MIRKIVATAAAGMVSFHAYAGYWELSAAIWDNTQDSSLDVAVTPVFRIEPRSLYLEAAIGFHLVSTHISASRVFSTAFQFGDHVGERYASTRFFSMPSSLQSTVFGTTPSKEDRPA